MPRLARAQTRLRIGLTAVILADQAAFLSRWAEYLSQHAQCAVSFATRDEYQHVHEMLDSGQVDAAWTCGYPFVRFQANLRLLAVPLYAGQPLYQAYLIRPTSGPVRVRRWSDLAGRVLAYSDRLSNSGWLVAQGQLMQAGLAPSQLKRGFFAHGHRNVAEAVASGLADAGAIDGYVWETMRQQGMAAALQTAVVWKSRQHAFPPLVAPLGADPSRLEPLRRSLLGMTADAQGRDLLKALNLDGFVVGQPGLFDSIRELAVSVPGSGVQA